MASQTEINRLIGTALLQSDFRARLLKDPAGTAKEVGIELTSTQAKFIGQIDPGELDNVAAQFQKAAHWSEMQPWPVW
jgi:hypothetical protein